MERENTPAPGPAGRILSLAGRVVHPFERAARRVLGPDGDLKVLAVVGAIVLYLLARSVATGIDRVFSVPVRVRPASNTIAVVGVSPATVAVTLRGTAEGFTAFDPDVLSVELETDPAEGTLAGVLEVGPKDVTNVFDRLRVVSVSPAEISVDYDFMSKMVTTNFVATPRRIGIPVQGTASVSIPTNFAVTVYGSVKKLGAFSAKGIRLPTDPVDVNGKTESFDTVVAIRPPEDSGITSVEPAEMPVHVEIRTRAAEDAGEIHVSAPILLAPEAVESAKPAPKPTETAEEPPEKKDARNRAEAPEEPDRSGTVEPAPSLAPADET